METKPEEKSIEIDFQYKDLKKKFEFPESTEIYNLYVFCSKEFKCGICSLIYNGINLNFIDKNKKLNEIFKDSLNKIKIIQKKKEFNSENQLSKNLKESENLIYKKGEITNLILDNKYNKVLKRKFNKITLTDEMIKENELFSFFTFFANCQTNKLEISPNGLLILDELFQKFDLDILANVSQLIIKGNKERIKFLKSNKYDINNLIFNNVRHLYIENANIIFKNTFPKLERLTLKNAFGVISEDKDFNYNNLSYLSLTYCLIKDLIDKTIICSKKIKKLDVLRIKLDSIDLENELDLNEYFKKVIFETAKEISINLKGKFSLREPIEFEKEKFERVLQKIKELRLLPSSNFGEEELKVLNNKLDNLNLFKLTNDDISNTEVLKDFIKNCKNLEYIDLGHENVNIQPDKIYKLIGYSNDIYNMDIYQNINYEKITKILLPCLEFSKKKGNLLIIGDMAPENQEINEGLFLLIKKIIFSTPYINKLVIKSFEKNAINFLNKFIVNFMNILSSPKIKKLKLIDIYVDKSLIDKLSFILMNSSSSLQKIEINNIITEDDEAEFIFYSLLFQIDYLNLEKIRFNNIKWTDSLVSLLTEFNDFNIFSKVKYASFISIENFEKLEPIIKESKFKGIELKNIPFSAEKLKELLIKNGNNYEWLSFDLNLNLKDKNINVLDVIANVLVNLPNLKVLKYYESFENLNDRNKFEFIEKEWHKIKKLRKFKIYVKKTSLDANKGRESKVLNLFKYLRPILKDEK